MRKVMVILIMKYPTCAFLCSSETNLSPRFILLSLLSTLVILYRLIIILSPKMRAYLLYIRFRLIRREVINTIVKKSFVGDWFLFYMLGQNVDSMIFKEVMHELARKLGHLGKDFNDT